MCRQQLRKWQRSLARVELITSSTMLAQQTSLCPVTKSKESALSCTNMHGSNQKAAINKSTLLSRPQSSPLPPPSPPPPISHQTPCETWQHCVPPYCMSACQHHEMACCRTVEEFRRVLDTNVLGAHAVTQAFLPLLKLGHKKTVLNMSSCLGSHGFLVRP